MAHACYQALKIGEGGSWVQAQPRLYSGSFQRWRGKETHRHSKGNREEKQIKKYVDVHCLTLLKNE